jgi:hypothetical protein
VFFTLGLIAVAACAVLVARQWPWKAALFPLVTGIPLLALAAAQLVLDFRGRAEESGAALDLTLTAGVSPDVARRRTAAIFAWIAGFIVLVALIGFPLTVPVFVFVYLVFQQDVRWPVKLALTAGAWAFFHGVFERLLQLPFEAGWVQNWLGW